MSDKSGNILYLLFGLLLDAVGYYAYDQYKQERVLVVVTDSTDCEAAEYSLLLTEKTISASGAQVRNIDFGSSKVNEVFFSFVGRPDGKGGINYRVKAQYKNCDEVLGPANVVNGGWVIYETIKNGEVLHDVRAK